jgi:hypothetical protein
VTGRFVRSAELDDGALVVSPPPGQTSPELSQHQAEVLFGSDPQVMGAFHGALLGYGLVSVEPGLGVDLTDVPAWVGLVWGGVYHCPAMTVPTAPTTTSAPQPTPGYQAVIISDSHDVFDYQSRGSACDSPVRGPSASPASETTSVPWQLVSLQPGTVTFRYQVPSCLASISPSSTSMGGNAKTGRGVLSVELTLPFNRRSCPTVWRQTSTLFAPPLGPGAPPPPHYTTVAHGPTGPVGAFQPMTQLPST